MDEDVSRIMAPYKSKLFGLLLFECILAVLIIALVLSIKFFLPKTYKSAQKWYAQNIAVDTDAGKVIKGVLSEI